jgi:hypothetical protein
MKLISLVSDTIPLNKAITDSTDHYLLITLHKAITSIFCEEGSLQVNTHQNAVTESLWRFHVHRVGTVRGF